jgi:hypothetical protein
VLFAIQMILYRHLPEQICPSFLVSVVFSFSSFFLPPRIFLLDSNPNSEPLDHLWLVLLTSLSFSVIWSACQIPLLCFFSLRLSPYSSTLFVSASASCSCSPVFVSISSFSIAMNLFKSLRTLTCPFAPILSPVRHSSSHSNSNGALLLQF